MTSRITGWFGVAGVTIGALAIAGSVWEITLPYRLSKMQTALLDSVVLLQLAGPLFAAGFGAAALRGDARGRKLGFVALGLGAIAFGFLLFSSAAHSTSRY